MAGYVCPNCAEGALQQMPAAGEAFHRSGADCDSKASWNMSLPSTSAMDVSQGAAAGPRAEVAAVVPAKEPTLRQQCARRVKLPGMACATPAWVVMTAAYIQCVTSSLIIFGFAALEPVLLNSGVYASRCPEAAPGDAPCDAQLEAVNLLFVVNSSVTLLGTLVVNGEFTLS